MTNNNTAQDTSTFQDFISNNLLNSVIDFNLKTGRNFQAATVEDQIEMINIQVRVAKEEVLEQLKAHQEDYLEYLDGVCDRLYTVPYLGWMCKNLFDEYQSLTLPEDVAFWEEKIVNLNLQGIELVTGLDAIATNLESIFTEGDIIEALERVIENNQLKYTNNVDVAESWKYNPEELKIKEVELNGEVWYSLENDWGKVKKFDDFPKVDLTDIVERALSRFDENVGDVNEE